ncbi:MAG: hypothetical protein V9E93_01100 [Steroidobacteraceae bacterium]
MSVAARRRACGGLDATGREEALLQGPQEGFTVLVTTFCFDFRERARDAGVDVLDRRLVVLAVLLAQDIEADRLRLQRRSCGDKVSEVHENSSVTGYPLGKALPGRSRCREATSNARMRFVGGWAADSLCRPIGVPPGGGMARTRRGLIRCLATVWQRPRLKG